MAPTRRPGRRSARPAQTGDRPRRATSRPARLQEPAGNETPVQPRARARRPPPPAEDQEASVEPSPPLSSHEVPVAGPSHGNVALQSQMLDLSNQVEQLKALLQAQSTSATSAAPQQAADVAPAVLSHQTLPPDTATLPVTQYMTSPFVDAIRMLSDTGTLSSTPNCSVDYIPMGFSRLDSSVNFQTPFHC